MNQHARSKSRAGFWLLGIAALAPLGMGARGCEQAAAGADCTDKANADSPACVCKYDGKDYAVGDGFESTDGCNHCGCQKDGKVACTRIGCVGDAGSGSGRGGTCGGLTGAGCDDGEYCKFAPEAQCGAADQTGTCTPKTEICTGIYLPVCGCDNMTYSNECVAAGQGISVARKGECGSTGDDGCDVGGAHYKPGENFPGPGGCGACMCDADSNMVCEAILCDPAQTCGGIAGIECSVGYCDFPRATLCGSGDQSGICKGAPDVCAEIFAPVCGCDGNSYSNACFAAVAGQSVLHAGECE